MRDLSPEEQEFLKEVGMELFKYIAKKYRDAQEKKLDFTRILEHADAMNQVTIHDP